MVTNFLAKIFTNKRRPTSLVPQYFYEDTIYNKPLETHFVSNFYLFDSIPPNKQQMGSSWNYSFIFHKLLIQK